MNQTVSEAIAHSKSHTEIARIHADARTGEYASICEELANESEGSVERDKSTTEFWGVDVNGVEWRVHVHAQHGVAEVFEEQ